MKKADLTIIAVITGMFVVAMFAIQPTTEASNNVSPTATPSPRKMRKTPKKSIEVENDETHLTRKSGTKVKTKKPAYKEGGVNDTTHRMRKPKKPNNFQEVSGIGMEVTKVKKNTKRKPAQYNPKEIGIDRSKSKRKN